MTSLRLAFEFFVLSAVLMQYAESQTSIPYYTTSIYYNSYACGNTSFSGETGNITSPNYPNVYGNLQFCTYYISAPQLSTINVTFNYLLLDYSYYCSNDWVEFVCQSNSLSPPIRHCGSTGFREDLSFKPCSKLIVRFRSDSYLNNYDAGFSITYQIDPIDCKGNCTPVPIGSWYNCTCDANQSEPVNPRPYNWCPDSCPIYNSDTESYCYCNSAFTTRSTPTVPTCPMGCVPYVDSYGYPVCYCNVTVTTTTPTTTTPLTCPYGCYLTYDKYGTPVCHCEGSTVTTPCPYGCYNVSYPWGTSYCSCSSTPMTTPLSITCPSGCYQSYDFWGTPYCSCSSGYTPATTTGYCYYPCYWGYDQNGYYTCLCTTTATTPTPSQRCNSSYTNTTGFVTSPNYPNNYPTNIACNYYISVQSANFIQVTFVDLQVYSCQLDFVEIIGCDGLSTQYCYIYGLGDITFPCNSITVQFHPSSFYSNRGFKLSYKAMYGSICNSTGGQATLGGTGTILSPFYPSNYPPNNDCYYVVQGTDSSMRIRVSFEQLFMPYSTSCMNDFLKFYCLTQSSDQPLLVCGNSSRSPVTFNCSSLEIWFHSDASQRDYSSPRLFKLVYHGVEGSTGITAGASLVFGSKLAIIWRSVLVAALVKVITGAVNRRL